MTDPRWRQVTEIFHRALEREAASRAAFVAEACAADSSLRAEVEALLAAHAHAGSFGDAPVVASIAHQLAAGTQVGPYRIEALVGAGGMGEVYRATDARLRRSVAIKVLPPTVAVDRDRVARFEREAQLLAALNHPNIAHIYGVEEVDGIPALVMEYVDGPTLADRIEQRAMPLADALPILRQIALALDAAHERGIIHRDLKPANVKLTADGTVKVLDFGLAKAMADSAVSQTVTSGGTREGMLLGSAAYMSPEQAAGKAVDARTDVWAFGCVAYELLTGDTAFPGDSVAETLAAVLTREPDWTRLPQATPSRVRRLLERCLRKDCRERLHAIADARLELEDLDGINSTSDSSLTTVRHRSLKGYVPVAAAVAIAAFGILAALRLRDRPAGVTFPVYSTLDAPAGYVLGEDDRSVSLPTRTPFVFTPDGKALIIEAAKDHKPQLFLRRLDSNESTPVAGTEGGRTPFVSPDGQWIGFADRDREELRKVPIGGGTPTTICTRCIDDLGPAGASWGPRDQILVGEQVGTGILFRIQLVSAAGGELRPVTPQPARLREHVSPFFLPDGERFLFADVSQTDASDTRLMLQSIRGGEPRLVIDHATDGRLLPMGQLVFMRLGTLMVAGFDQRTATVTTAPTAVMGSVMQSALRSRADANNTGQGMFAVSSLGTLAAIHGPLPGTGQRQPLVWIDHHGGATPAESASTTPDGNHGYTRISPDGSRIATTVISPLRASLWFLDLTRGVWSECRDCGRSVAKAWSPDGQRILLFPESDSIVEHTIDGSAGDRVLIREPHRIISPAQWLPDGRIVYVSEHDPDGATAVESSDKTSEIKLWTPTESTARAIVTNMHASSPEVSPNGRWLAFEAMIVTPSENPLAHREVFVQAFPGPGMRTQVSEDEGANPAWSRDGKTLYYLKPQVGMYAVDVGGDGPVFRPGTPRLLFSTFGFCSPVRCFDVSRDGSRFLMTQRTAAATVESVTRLDLILNWTSTLPPAR